MVIIMNKNYYDILQINQNASPEIIEKAYKTLAKKYHPDLQEESNKKQAEEILKEINEAYEILSDPNKKNLYDQNLKNQTISQEEYDQVHEENEFLKEKLNNLNRNYSNNVVQNNDVEYQSNLDNTQKQELEYQQKQRELQYMQQLEQARQKAYHDAYIQDLKNRGYKIRYKKSIKDYIKGFISIIIVILILILLWQIPFVHNFFIKLYEENEIIHSTIDTINNLFN